MEELSVVDLGPFLSNSDPSQHAQDCKKVADILHKTSCLIIRDPRVSYQKNSDFIDMMEKYFGQEEAKIKPDIHPEMSYQVGATPEFIEFPRDHADVIEKLAKSPGNEATKPIGGDKKWRFFWKMGERPPKTEFPDLDCDNVTPTAFPNWSETMNEWGKLMLQATETVATMLAVGLGLPPNKFVDMMKYGAHLLAPTGSNLSKFGDLASIFAGFHYDFNFLTIHGKSRYPGLSIWLRDGRKMGVKVPDGCLLIQAGKQLEWLTAGYITAGFHEVVVTDDTRKTLAKAQEEGRSQWRISSTLFSHIAADQTLEPLMKNPEESEEVVKKKYPSTKCGIQVQDELAAINLSATASPKQQ